MNIIAYKLYLAILRFCSIVILLFLYVIAVKVWNSARRLCSTFVGHCGAVTGLLPYPYGPMAISCSLDSTMRVWDLAAFDQVQM